MFRRIVPLAAVAALMVPAGSLRAQQATSVELSPYAGYMVSSGYLSGPLGTSLGTSGGALYGLQAAIPVSGSVAVYGNVAYSKPSLRLGLPILGGVDFGSNEMLLYDGGLELRVPAKARGITPFLQVGAGGVHNVVSAAGIDLTATNFAVNGGLGLDVGFLPNATLRLMAKDYVGKFDFQDAVGIGGIGGDTAHNVGLTAGLRVTF